MKSIGNLLRRGRSQEGAEFSAAFVLGLMNEILVQQLALPDSDARAITFQHGTITVAVSHGAVAGLIQQSADELLKAANKKITAHGQSGAIITKIITRPMTSPSR